jgi:hypothetical protein
MVPLLLTFSIGEDDEVQGRSLRRLLNRGGCNRPGPFFSHFHSLKSQSVAGQVPAGDERLEKPGHVGILSDGFWLTR